MVSVFKLMYEKHIYKVQPFNRKGVVSKHTKILDIDWSNNLSHDNCIVALFKGSNQEIVEHIAIMLQVL